ncbi:MAG: LysM peptidoglycan-binding domain-containing protein [Chloroflexota bacterium]
MCLDRSQVGLALLVLALAVGVSACQLVERAAPTAVPPAGQLPAGQSGVDQSPADQSPRIRNLQDVPPTWTPPATVRSETPIAPEAVVTAQAAGSQTTYTVQSGDTLAEIAIRFNVTLEALAAANDIEDFDHIEAGQVLVIPR